MALANHRTWLLGQAEKLFPFFERRLINPLGGFYDLDEEGRPNSAGLRRGRQARPVPFRNRAGAGP
jgi:sulfoquinovose isomerase